MLEHIKYSPLENLVDRDWLESAVIKAGLGARPHEFPKEMHQYFGGLSIWQYPCQLAPYLIELSNKRVESYCEIGVFHGGMFAFTIEYLSRFTPIKVAVAVDIDITPELRAYANSNPIVLLVGDKSTSAGARQVIDEIRPQLTFIDADHSEKACQADYEIVKNISKFIGFHDLVEHSCPGVAEVWKDVEGKKWEYIDQYLGVERPTYGIGLVERS